MNKLQACRLGAVSGLCALALGACGSTSSSQKSGTSGTIAAASQTSTTNRVASVAALVPAQIQKSGTLTVALDASYPPDEFIGANGHTVVGMDADLVDALAGVMGIKANLINATWDTIIPGLVAGKFDMAASSVTDTKAREKTVNFVDYFKAGESFFTKATGGASITGIGDICGKTVAVENGTDEQTDANAQSQRCKAEGKPAVTVLSFQDQNGANLALSSGRAQLGFADSPVAAYEVKQTHGQFKIVGPSYDTAPYGLVCPKNKLDDAVEAAVRVVMRSGTYAKILKKWGLISGAIPVSEVKVNGAVS